MKKNRLIRQAQDKTANPPSLKLRKGKGEWEKEALKLFAKVSVFLLEKQYSVTNSDKDIDNLLQLRQEWLDFISSLLSSQKQRIREKIERMPTIMLPPNRKVISNIKWIPRPDVI
ncbi:MAG: hypothetical protein AABY22_21680, partial [Nanoarchaeota archaeon]